jgi:holo-[acyl-carrier protein] synthase
MILGIGNDLIDIRRIEDTLERFGERFEARIFTPVERAKADRRQSVARVRASTLAKRFAAKAGLRQGAGEPACGGGVFGGDRGVVNAPSGEPTLALTGGAAARLAEITPPGTVARLHLTMTDDYPWAEAVGLIEAVPAPPGA